MTVISLAGSEATEFRFLARWYCGARLSMTNAQTIRQNPS